MLKRNLKFVENHTKIKCFVWSQEREEKEIAEVCPNWALENQELFVEIVFPSGYYALRIGEKAKVLKKAEQKWSYFHFTNRDEFWKDVSSSEQD